MNGALSVEPATASTVPGSASAALVALSAIAFLVGAANGLDQVLARVVRIGRLRAERGGSGLALRRLKDGRTVSCVMPYVRHIDHTEHDIHCVVTEQGFALNTEIRSAKRRAEDIISKCAHPHFRPVLRDYLRIAGGGDEPRATKMDLLTGWWKDYEAVCRSFPNSMAAEE